VKLLQVKKLVEAVEIAATEKCVKSKDEWQRMSSEGHENSYAACVRWETWREAATMIADLGQAIDDLGKTEEEKV
jgi:hypothetical protein